MCLLAVACLAYKVQKSLRCWRYISHVALVVCTQLMELSLPDNVQVWSLFEECRFAREWSFASCAFLTLILGDVREIGLGILWLLLIAVAVVILIFR